MSDLDGICSWGSDGGLSRAPGGGTHVSDRWVKGPRRATPQVDAAGDIGLRAGDPAGIVGGRKGDRVGDVRNLADPAEGGETDVALQSRRTCEHLGSHIGTGESDCDGVDGDVAGTEVFGQGVAEHVEYTLGERTADAVGRGEAGGDGGDVDDPVAVSLVP